MSFSWTHGASLMTCPFLSSFGNVRGTSELERSFPTSSLARFLLLPSPAIWTWDATLYCTKRFYVVAGETVVIYLWIFISWQVACNSWLTCLTVWSYSMVGQHQPALPQLPLQRWRSFVWCHLVAASFCSWTSIWFHPFCCQAVRTVQLSQIIDACKHQFLCLCAKQWNC